MPPLLVIWHARAPSRSTSSRAVFRLARDFEGSWREGESVVRRCGVGTAPRYRTANEFRAKRHASRVKSSPSRDRDVFARRRMRNLNGFFLRNAHAHYVTAIMDRCPATGCHGDRLKQLFAPFPTIFLPWPDKRCRDEALRIFLKSIKI